MLMILGVITFLDRINISAASTKMMSDLNIDEDIWGWILSAFVLSYGLFQLPLGILGDKKGHIIILAAIVVWWSVFTILTGLSTGFFSLLIIRFGFGIGEAGSYPCTTGVISKWFKKSELGRAQGFIWAASRIGGALTPFAVYPALKFFGWRTVFLIMGGIGIIWVSIWLFYARNNQQQKKTEQKPAVVDNKPKKAPFSEIIRKKQFWILLAMYFCYAWGSWFFFSWFPIFMEKGRGFEGDFLMYAIALPFVLSMIGNITGGFLSDSLSKKFGLKTGRRVLGVGGLFAAAVFVFLAAFIPGKMEVFIFLSLAFGVIDLMLPSAWAICMDLGKDYSGSLSGAMNTAGNLGGFICASLFGYLVKFAESKELLANPYNLPLFIISGMLIISGILFFALDPTKPLIKE